MASRSSVAANTKKARQYDVKEACHNSLVGSMADYQQGRRISVYKDGWYELAMRKPLAERQFLAERKRLLGY